MLSRDLSNAADFNPDLLQALFDQSVEGRLVVGLQDQARVAQPLDGLHDEVGDILIFAGSLVRDAVREDDLSAGAPHDEAFDDFPGADICLAGLFASGILVVLKLGLVLEVEVARCNKEIIQTHHKYTGLLSRWTMLAFNASSVNAETAPVPKRDVTIAAVLLSGLC